MGLLLRLEARLAAAERLVIFCTAVALIVTLTIQILNRYLLPMPLAFTVELVRVELVWFVFAGAAHATYLGEHFVLALLFDKARFPGKRGVAIAVDLAVILFFGWLAYYGLRLAIGNPQMYPALHMPVAISYIAVPIGAAAITFHFAVALLRTCLESGQRAT